jgi:alpha-1,4-digalacturonate transport system permease protein
MYEAAQLDAATPWRTLRRITLPLLMPNLIVVLVLALIRAVQIFDEVFVLTGGGPGSATTFIVQFIYQTGFAEQIHLYGLAAAASLLLALGLIALTLAQLRLTRASEAGQKAR